MEPLTLWVIDDKTGMLDACEDAIRANFSVEIHPRNGDVKDVRWRELVERCHPQPDGDGWRVNLVEVAKKRRAWAVVDELFAAERAEHIPDIALIDVDFVGEPEDKEYFGEVFRRGANTSAHLGFSIGAKLEETGRRVKKPVVWGLYTAHKDVTEGYWELRSEMQTKRGLIPRLLNIDTKEGSEEDFCDLIKKYVREARRRRIESGRWPMPIEAATRLSQQDWNRQLMPDQQLTAGMARERFRHDWLINSYDLWVMFPREASRFFEKLTRCADAVQEILQECAPFDLNWALCCALKLVWVGRDLSARKVALTPLADAIHNSTLREREVELIRWLQNECSLALDTRRRIVAEAQELGGLNEWVAHLRKPGGKTVGWIDSLRNRLPGLCRGFAEEWGVPVDCAEEELYGEPLLLDWELLFNERTGLLRRYLEICRAEKAQHFKVETRAGGTGAVEVVVSVVPLHHCGTTDNFKGQRIDEMIHAYGEAWYEATVKPPSGCDKAAFHRMDIWPKNSGIEVNRPNVKEPALELHWLFRNYLATRRLGDENNESSFM